MPDSKIIRWHEAHKRACTLQECALCYWDLKVLARYIGASIERMAGGRWLMGSSVTRIYG